MHRRYFEGGTLARSLARKFGEGNRESRDRARQRGTRGEPGSTTRARGVGSEVGHAVTSRKRKMAGHCPGKPATLLARVRFARATLNRNREACHHHRLPLAPRAIFRLVVRTYGEPCATRVLSRACEAICARARANAERAHAERRVRGVQSDSRSSWLNMARIDRLFARKRTYLA